MNKDDRSSLNPFTGKKHLDLINDDSFLNQSYNEYNKIIQRSNILDNTFEGQMVIKVATNLINAIEGYLIKIGRFDYIENYYDWEFHLVGNETVNAFCMPGGKIVVFSGILSVAKSEEEIAFILAHEISHALLDHSRTQQSARNVKNGLEIASLIGSIALDLTGNHELANVTRGATLAADVGSEFLLLKPFGRTHEIEADKLGMIITYLAGYDIHNIPGFWQAMSAKNSNNHDFFSTHPSDSKRIASMKELILDIDNNKDFYSVPILSDLNKKLDNNSNNGGFTMNIPTVQTTQPTLSAVDSGSIKNNGFKVIKDNFCTNCGFPTSKADFFCINCGHKLSVKCPKCGMDVNSGDVFCTNCGCKLNF